MSAPDWKPTDTSALRRMLKDAEEDGHDFVIPVELTARLLDHAEALDRKRAALKSKVDDLALQVDSWRGETRAVLAKMEAMRKRHAAALAERDATIEELRHKLARAGKPVADEVSP